MSEYLLEMSAILREEHGTIDKFLGDGILAFFNAPHDVPDHARRACTAAVRCMARLEELNRAWEAAGKSAFRVRIGLHVGDTLVGNIGTPERFDYTVMGDPVNLASRLESLNKLYGTSILTSDEVRREAGPGFEWRTLDRVAVVGRASATLVCELLGEAGSLPSRTCCGLGRLRAGAGGVRGGAVCGGGGGVSGGGVDLAGVTAAAVEMAGARGGAGSGAGAGWLERGVRADVEAVAGAGARAMRRRGTHRRRGRFWFVGQRMGVRRDAPQEL